MYYLLCWLTVRCPLWEAQCRQSSNWKCHHKCCSVAAWEEREEARRGKKRRERGEKRDKIDQKWEVNSIPSFSSFSFLSFPSFPPLCLTPVPSSRPTYISFINERTGHVHVDLMWLFLLVADSCHSCIGSIQTLLENQLEKNGVLVFEEEQTREIHEMRRGRETTNEEERRQKWEKREYNGDSLPQLPIRWQFQCYPPQSPT